MRVGQKGPTATIHLDRCKWRDGTLKSESTYPQVNNNESGGGRLETTIPLTIAGVDAGEGSVTTKVSYERKVKSAKNRENEKLRQERPKKR